MANPVPAKFTKQMAVMTTPEIGGEVGAWAEVLGVPHSQALRELVEAGLKAKRKEWAREFGALDADKLAAHIERCTRQGGQQLDRRRSYDHDRRGAAPTEAPTGSSAAHVERALSKSARKRSTPGGDQA